MDKNPGVVVCAVQGRGLVEESIVRNKKIRIPTNWQVKFTQLHQTKYNGRTVIRDGLEPCVEGSIKFSDDPFLPAIGLQADVDFFPVS